MSEFNSEDNPHGIYREEDDSKIEDLLDQEIAEQVNVVPDGMEWVQQALFDMNKNMMNNMQNQINAFGASLMKNLPDMIKRELNNTQSNPGPVNGDESVQGNILNELVDLNSKVRGIEVCSTQPFHEESLAIVWGINRLQLRTQITVSSRSCKQQTY